MKNSCLIVVLLTILIGCKKENANRNNAVSNTPKSIIYQDLDTVTGNYVTTQTYYLFPDSSGIYFDSAQVSIPNLSPNQITIIFNHSLFNSKKYIFYSNSFFSLDSNDVSIIKFDNNNRIFELHDHYSLILDEPTFTGDGSNNELSYSNFSTPYTFLSHFGSLYLTGSVNSFIYKYDIKTANSDSLTIESGIHPDGIYKHLRYTVISDEKENNCNLFQMSGIIHPVDGVNSISSLLFMQIVSKIPIPNIKSKLVKSIFITQVFDGDILSGGFTSYVKYADFSYEFDSNNRVTKAVITPHFDPQYITSAFPFIKPSRILISY
ncbi:MAG: hypothetical protein U0U67_10440 [Chitinophagales bacterium]